MRALTLVLVALTGCSAVVDQVVEPEDLSDVAEAYCALHPELPCGHVYQCETGPVEFCVIGPWRDVPEVEALYGACTPTPRHVGLCWYCCGAGCTAGCNALNGCWCPQ